MKIVRTKRFPFGEYKALNLLGIWLFYKGEENPSPRLINHERIHTRQMVETFFVGFYLWYAIEYVVIRFFHKKQLDAYYDISFEEEAHRHDSNPYYLDERGWFTYRWLKYVKPKSNRNNEIGKILR